MTLIADKWNVIDTETNEVTYRTHTLQSVAIDGKIDTIVFKPEWIDDSISDQTGQVIVVEAHNFNIADVAVSNVTVHTYHDGDNWRNHIDGRADWYVNLGYIRIENEDWATDE